MSQPPIQPPASDHLRLLQINLNKSEAAQLELINDELSNNYDIILIQELGLVGHCSAWQYESFFFKKKFQDGK